MPPTRFQRGAISLQVKLVAALVVIVLTPLLVSAYLVAQLDKVAEDCGSTFQSFVGHEAAARHAPLERAELAYLALIDTTKQLEAERARRIAADPRIAAMAGDAPLDAILDRENGLVRIALVAPGGAVLAERSRPLPAGDWRTTEVSFPLAGDGTLALSFVVPASLQDDRDELHRVLGATESIAQVRTALPSRIRNAFWALVGGAVVIAMLIGMFAARVVTRRIGALLQATRAVSAGTLDARVTLRGRDEMAELAVGFNTMLDDLDAKRRQIEYLQRIGAWQDVARKLAHEIKNPLTPIQLAVQQCVSSYAGADPRYARLLADTGEIVGEEIAALKRLVDTFRTLGQLPRVEAAPLALAELVEELKLDPALATRLTVKAPAAPLTVRADKLLLKRVLVNLVENGMHAGQEAGNDGAVDVGWTSAPDGRSVLIDVDDRGKGVAAEARDRIFEPYVTTKATGTGLGLAIAKKIALEHDGDLQVMPEPAPTGGARFRVTLPLA